jgi:hypothetical protein
MKKNEKNKHILQFEKKHIFFSALFGLVSWLCISKMICRALRRCSYNILNHSKWGTIEKDLPKCSVIGK